MYYVICTHCSSTVLCNGKQRMQKTSGKQQGVNSRIYETKRADQKSVSYINWTFPTVDHFCVAIYEISLCFGNGQRTKEPKGMPYATCSQVVQTRSKKERERKKESKRSTGLKLVIRGDVYKLLQGAHLTSLEHSQSTLC